jgi:hypothetical protein
MRTERIRAAYAQFLTNHNLEHDMELFMYFYRNHEGLTDNNAYAGNNQAQGYNNVTRNNVTRSSAARGIGNSSSRTGNVLNNANIINNNNSNYGRAININGAGYRFGRNTDLTGSIQRTDNLNVNRAINGTGVNNNGNYSNDNNNNYNANINTNDTDGSGRNGTVYGVNNYGITNPIDMQNNGGTNRTGYRSNRGIGSVNDDLRSGSYDYGGRGINRTGFNSTRYDDGNAKNSLGQTYDNTSGNTSGMYGTGYNRSSYIGGTGYRTGRNIGYQGDSGGLGTFR